MMEYGIIMVTIINGGTCTASAEEGASDCYELNVSQAIIISALVTHCTIDKIIKL